MPRWYAEHFAEAARALAADSTVVGTLERIVRLAATTIPGAQYAGITTKTRSESYKTIALTDRLALQVDEIQYEANEGPCLMALEGVQIIRSGDLAADGRWPVFGPAASQATGVMSMLSSPLYLEGSNVLGALNTYATKPDAFEEMDVSGLAILATHSAIALTRAADREKNEHLENALKSNRKIGAAVGILMANHKLTEEQAFDALRIASQHTHKKLYDVAFEVVETGHLELPPRSAARA
jgi:GAF domain-containing protein